MPMNFATQQLNSLMPCQSFFREQQFARLAVTMSKSAVLPTGKTPLEIITCAYRKSNPDIFVMQSAEDRAAQNTSYPLYGAR